MLEEGSPRKSLGERTVSRIAERQSRKLRVGLVTAMLMRSATPELAGSEGTTEGDFTFLSAAPFYALMRRLAQARWRRDRRTAALERRYQPKLRAFSRRWPGEAKLATPKFSAVVQADGLILPQAPTPEAPLSTEAGPAPRRLKAPQRRSEARALLSLLEGSKEGRAILDEVARFEEERPVVQITGRSASQPSAENQRPVEDRGVRPALSRSTSPVSRAPAAQRSTSSSTSRKLLPSVEEEVELSPIVSPARARPMDRVGSRMRKATASASPLAKALEKRLPPHQARQSALFAELLSDAPAPVVERILHALNPRVEAEVAPDAKPRPSRRAVERLSPAASGAMRSLSGSSPSMAVVAPAAPSAGATNDTTSETGSLVPRAVSRAASRPRKASRTSSSSGATNTPSVTTARSNIGAAEARSPAISQPAPRSTVAGSPVRTAPASPAPSSAGSTSGAPSSVRTNPTPTVGKQVASQDAAPTAAVEARLPAADRAPVARGAAAAPVRPAPALSASNVPSRNIVAQATHAPEVVEEEAEVQVQAPLRASARAAIRGMEATAVDRPRASEPVQTGGRFLSSRAAAAPEQSPALERAAERAVAPKVAARSSLPAAPEAVLPQPLGATSERATTEVQGATVGEKTREVRVKKPAARSAAHAAQRLGAVASTSASAKTMLAPVAPGRPSPAASAAPASPRVPTTAAASSERTVAQRPLTIGARPVALGGLAGPLSPRATPAREEAPVRRSLLSGEPSETDAVQAVVPRSSHLARSLTRALPVARRSALAGLKAAIDAAPAELAEALAAAPELRSRLEAISARADVPAASEAPVQQRLTGAVTAAPRSRSLPVAETSSLPQPLGATPEVPADSRGESRGADGRSPSRPGRPAGAPRTIERAAASSGTTPDFRSVPSAIRRSPVRRSAAPSLRADGKMVPARLDPAVLDELISRIEAASEPLLLPLSDQATSPALQETARRNLGTLAAAIERERAPLMQNSAAQRSLGALEAALKPLRSRSLAFSPSPMFFASTQADTPSASAAMGGDGTSFGSRDYSGSAPVPDARGRFVAARSVARTVRVIRDRAGRRIAVPSVDDQAFLAAAPAVAAALGLPPGTAPSVVAARLMSVEGAAPQRSAGRRRVAVADTGTLASPVGAPSANVAAISAGNQEVRPVRSSSWALRRAAVNDAPGVTQGRRASTPAALMAMAPLAQPVAQTTDAAGNPQVGGTASSSPAAIRSAARASRQSRSPALRSSARTADLGSTLHQVSQGTPDSAAPSWAARTSEQATGLRTVDSLVASLARATSVEEVVRVIVQRVEGSGVEIPAVLSSPFNDVVQQLRNEARAEVDRALAAEAPVTRPNRMAAPEAAPLQPSRTRSFRHGGRSVGASAMAVDGVGNSRVMKLVRKLQGLIHLAEEERRLSDARRRVRMAEDSASARAEGQAPMGKGGSPAHQRHVDVEALSREVTEIVTREIEHRRSRRMEDSDEFGW